MWVQLCSGIHRSLSGIQYTKKNLPAGGGHQIQCKQLSGGFFRSQDQRRSMSSDDCRKYPKHFFARTALALTVSIVAAGDIVAQQVPATIPGQSAGPTAGSFQGSVTTGQAT